MENKMEDFDMIGDDDDMIDISDDKGIGTAEDNEFDLIVGMLEEILVDDSKDSFTSLQKKYCNEHCSKFDDSDENKIIYTDIFQNYKTLIETILDNKLKSRIPGFTMSKFEHLLASRKDEIMGDIFDLLLSFDDFFEFKELMLQHKKEQAPAKDSHVYSNIKGLDIVGSSSSSNSSNSSMGLSIGGLSIGGTSIKKTKNAGAKG